MLRKTFFIIAMCLVGLSAWGATQYMNLGEENMERIRNFIRSGKGAVGICAGAYLFTDTPGYACMHINGGKAIDIEHDNRGYGISAFSLTAEGKKLFPELAKRDEQTKQSMMRHFEHLKALLPHK